MPERNEVYKCELCGNIVEVLTGGAGQLVCCGQPMKLQQENTTDAATEKHVPVIEGKKVVVGSVEHPMQEDHYIEWVEVIVDGKYSRKLLTPNDKPEAEFCITGEEIKARMYCNIHGLWETK